jgi:hypothetical protein
VWKLLKYYGSHEMLYFKEKPKSMDLLAQNNLECPEMYLKDKRIHCEVGYFSTPTRKMNKLKLSISKLK